MNNSEYLFIPGGPWISGEYWDAFILKYFSHVPTRRYTLLNHEKEYSSKNKFSKYELLAHFNEFIMKNEGMEKVIIAHSYGCYLTLQNVLEFSNLMSFKIILVSMPASSVKSTEFRKITEKHPVTIKSNDDFSARFKRISPAYFNKYDETFFDSIFSNVYMEGNEDFIFTMDKIKELAKFAEANELNHIIGSDDHVIGNLDLMNGHVTKAIPITGHFPMIESPEIFTDALTWI